MIATTWIAKALKIAHHQRSRNIRRGWIRKQKQSRAGYRNLARRGKPGTGKFYFQFTPTCDFFCVSRHPPARASLVSYVPEGQFTHFKSFLLPVHQVDFMASTIESIESQLLNECPNGDPDHHYRGDVRKRHHTTRVCVRVCVCQSVCKGTGRPMLTPQRNTIVLRCVCYKRATPKRPA